MQENTLLEEAKSLFDHWRLTRTKHGGGGKPAPRIGVLIFA